MHQMPINIKEARSIRRAVDHMVIPDFFVHCPWLHRLIYRAKAPFCRDRAGIGLKKRYPP
jgi:hypothetical protein